MSTLDDAVGDSSFLAKMRQVDNQLNRIHIMSNNNQLGLLILDQPNAMIQPLLDEHGLVADLALLLAVLGNRLGLLDKTGPLLLLCLGTVLVQELEERGGGVLIEDVGELGNCRRNLESLLEDFLLALQTDIFWPFDVSGQVLAGLDVAACDGSERTLDQRREEGDTDSKVLGALLDERVLRLLGGLVLRGERGGSDLLLGSLCMSVNVRRRIEYGTDHLVKVAWW